jgi:hypothetical protein
MAPGQHRLSVALCFLFIQHEGVVCVQDEAGLEVKMASGEWVVAPPVPGEQQLFNSSAAAL